MSESNSTLCLDKFYPETDVYTDQTEHTARRFSA